MADKDKTKPGAATPGESQNDGIKMVSVPEDMLKELVNKIGILERAVPAAGLAYAMGTAEKKPIIRRVNLNVYRDLEKQEERVILGWRTVIDEVFTTSQGFQHEKQIIRLFLEDDNGAMSEKGIDMDYTDFIRRLKKQPAEIMTTTTTEDGKTMFKVRRVPDGKEYTIDKTFVN
jgi:hypothetical protein